MVSLGTELRFVFCTASYKVGLALTSGPPVRAATSMFLISFAKSLPRLASTTAFLCFVVAHLEWPLTWCPSLLSGRNFGLSDLRSYPRGGAGQAARTISQK